MRVIAEFYVDINMTAIPDFNLLLLLSVSPFVFIIDKTHFFYDCYFLLLKLEFTAFYRLF
jgi:hypothetical protein